MNTAQSSTQKLNESQRIVALKATLERIATDYEHAAKARELLIQLQSRSREVNGVA